MNKKQSVLDYLEDQLKNDLPGQYYQNLMSPILDNEKYRIVPQDHKIACVLALIHTKEDGEHYLTYILRASSHPKDKHAGQVGFPGGKFENDDKSLMACAIREVEEELGIPSSEIDIIGELTSLYVFASNFLVYPFIGVLNETPKYVRQISEVDDVIEIPLMGLLDVKIKIQKSIQLAEGSTLLAPGYDLEGKFLWGATAMISSEIEKLVRQALVAERIKS